MPVYTARPLDYDGVVLDSHSEWIPHNRIGCYVIQSVDQDTRGNSWYQIKWANNQQRWVPYQRMGIVAVQVEDASTPPLPARTVVHTEESNIKVRSFPAIARDRFGQPYPRWTQATIFWAPCQSATVMTSRAPIWIPLPTEPGMR